MRISRKLLLISQVVLLISLAFPAMADSLIYPAGVPVTSLDSLLSNQNQKNIDYIKSGFESCKKAIFLEFTTTANEDWYNDETCNWLAYLGTGLDPNPATPSSATMITLHFLVNTNTGDLRALQNIMGQSDKQHPAFKVIVYASLINQNLTPRTENYFQVGTFEVPEASFVAPKQSQTSVKAPKTVITNRKIMISCIKGSSTKQVSGIKPSCPNGYKIKK